MTENHTDPSNVLNQNAPEIKKPRVSLNFDFFGLSKLWTVLPHLGLSPNQHVFVISLLVFLAYAGVAAVLGTPLQNSLPAYLILGSAVIATWINSRISNKKGD